jgi:CubicO group peptidase (beta-lactamase class C family)
MTPKKPIPPLRLQFLAALALSMATGCGPSPWGDASRLGEDAPPLSAVRAQATSLVDLRAQPTRQGMDEALLEAAVAEAASLSRLHNMIVARHGEIVLERSFRGPSPTQATNVKSVSKTLLSAVVGRAIEDGILDGIHQEVGPFFAAELANGGQAANAEGDPRSRITVGDLLSMSSGLESTSFGSRYGRWVSSSNWVRYALEQPVVHEPGARLIYSTGDTHLMSAVLTRASGRSTHELARTLLAEPLSIALPPWPRDPQGVHFGGNDMLISPRGLLRFGEMYRQGGELDGVRILSREWVEESWRIRVRSPRNGDGYGLGWWARTSGGHPARFAWGYGGQFLFVVPSLELTVVFTSDPWSRERGHNQRLHRILDDLLVPAAERGAQAG